MTLSISRGSDWTYVAHQVGNGTENYYTAAVETGEPPGQWRGSLAEAVGLQGQVDDLQMEALYGEKIDPEDPNFLIRENWADAKRMGRKAYRFMTAEQHLEKLIAQEPDPANIEPERMEELKYRAKKAVRESRDFFDLTYSPPKSVTVLHTAARSEENAARARGDEAAAERWAAKAQTIERAIWDASGEMITFMEANAGYTRVGYQGGELKDGSTTGRRADAHGFIVSSFLQHTARPVGGIEAPHLHVHNLILNRVKSADGRWRTLDGKALYAWRAGAGATADRVMMSQLSRELGVEFEYDPRSKSHEVVGIDRQVRDLFSPRRAAINKLLPEYVEAFKQRMGREPHALELSRLAQSATLHSRERKLAKTQAKPLAEKVEMWAAQVREAVDTSLSEVAANAINDPEAVRGAAFNPADVIAKGVASVQESKAHWTRSDLMAHMQRHLPGVLVNLDPEYQTTLLMELADQAVRPDPAKAGAPDEIIPLAAPELVNVPDVFRLDDGTSAYRRAESEQYATRALLEDEAQIESTAATDLAAVRLDPERADAAIDAVNARLSAADPDRKAKLGTDQSEAIRGILTSGARSEVLIGPAGTGKSFVLGNLADIWEKQIGGRVYGLATAQTAADVLKHEGIRNTANIDKWLDAQDQIDNGELTRRETNRWKLTPRDIVFVDEASMADTRKLAEIERRVIAAGAKIVRVGDDKQLGAVGPGGAFRLAADAGSVYKLDGVRRFKSEWERQASLQLRDGDEAVLREYDVRGRIVQCASPQEAREKAARAYTADLISGKRGYLAVDTNEAAFEVATEVRNNLVQLGRVAQEGVRVGQDGMYTVAGVGDIIAARKNRNKIKDSQGNPITNRNLYEVVDTYDDGDLTVRAVGESGELGARMTIPARYARRHVSLAYAMTQHGVQGKTGDTGRAIISSKTSAEAAYVGLTRGRETNVAYVYDDAEHTSPDAPQRPAIAILADVITRDGTEVSATEHLRNNLEDAGSMRVIGSRLADAHEELMTARYDDLVNNVAPNLADSIISDRAKPTLYRALDAAEATGHDTSLVLRHAIQQRELGSADSVAKVLWHRITTDIGDDIAAAQQTTEGEPTGDTYSERVVDGTGDVHRYAREYAEMADQRANALGEIQTRNPAPWARDHLGPVPADPLDREDWATRAGRVEAYREEFGITDEHDPIGRAPVVHNAYRRATWFAAWRALGRPDQTRDEQTMTDAQLQVAVDAYEAEKSWAPPSVSAELRETSIALAETRERAAFVDAEVQELTGPERIVKETQEYIPLVREANELARREQKLNEVHQTRGAWRIETTPQRLAAEAATRELNRRADEAAKLAAERAATAEAGTEAEHAQEQNNTAEAAQSPQIDLTTARDLMRGRQAQNATEQADQDATTDKPTPVPASAAFTGPATGRGSVDVDQAVAAAQAAAAQLADRAGQRAVDDKAKQRAQADQDHRAREAAEAARRDAADRGMER